MKTEIQQYMEARITEIRNQNTMFDIAVVAAEGFFKHTFNADSPTQYSLVLDEYLASDVYVIISLDETSGITNIAFNYADEQDQWVRYATVTITSTGIVNEVYDDIKNPQMRDDAFRLTTSIYKALGDIKGDDTGEAKQSSGEPET